MVKKVFKSRTVWLAIAQAIAGILAVILAENPELATVGSIVIAKAALDFVLRMDTKEAIADK